MKPRVASVLGKILFSTLLTLLLLEVVFRFAGWAILSRMDSGGERGEIKILCLGDSFTYGVGAKRENSYPMQLQRILEKKDGCSAKVINRGIPGMNTSLIRENLEENLLKFNPDIVIVMAGVNNSWNQAGVSGITGERNLTDYIKEVIYRLKTYKLARLFIYNIQFKRKYSKSTSSLPAQYDFERSFKEKGQAFASRKTVSEGGIETTINYKPGNNPVNSGMFIMILKNDYKEINRIISRHGANLVIMTYPNKGVGHITALNSYLRDISRENENVLIDNENYFLKNISKEDYPKYFQKTGGHPNDAGYGIMAKSVETSVYSAAYINLTCFSEIIDK